MPAVQRNLLNGASAITWPTDAVAVSISGAAPLTVTFSVSVPTASFKLSATVCAGRDRSRASDPENHRGAPRLVVSRRERRRPRTRPPVGHDDCGPDCRRVVHRDRHTRHHCALRVGDRTLQAWPSIARGPAPRRTTRDKGCRGNGVEVACMNILRYWLNNGSR